MSVGRTITLVIGPALGLQIAGNDVLPSPLLAAGRAQIELQEMDGRPSSGPRIIQCYDGSTTDLSLDRDQASIFEPAQRAVFRAAIDGKLLGQRVRQRNGPNILQAGQKPERQSDMERLSWKARGTYQPRKWYRPPEEFVSLLMAGRLPGYEGSCSLRCAGRKAKPIRVKGGHNLMRPLIRQIIR